MRATTTRRLYIEAARIVGKRVKIVHPLPLLMRIDFDDGIRLFTYGNKPDLNRGATKKITNDKDLTVRLLKEESLPTPTSHFVWMTRKKIPSSRNLESSIEFRKLQAFIVEVGYPIFLKPNKGSQGRNVFCIRNEDELKRVTRRLLRTDQGFYIAQEACIGEEYRVAIIQGEIALAYKRKPLSVVGDGVSTIAELFEKKKNDLSQSGRGISLKANSEKIALHLEMQGYSLSTVPKNGQEVTLLSNRNLSDGSEPVECTEEIRAKYAQLCRDVHEKCGVDYCGLDLMEDTRSGSIKPMIIELNSSPGWKHFVRSSSVNAGLVRDVFVQALQMLHHKTWTARSAHRPLKKQVAAGQTIKPETADV